MSRLSGRTWRTLDGIEKPIEQIDREHARNILVHLTRRGDVGALPTLVTFNKGTRAATTHHGNIDPELIGLLIEQIDNGPEPSVTQRLGFWKLSWNRAAKRLNYPGRASYLPWRKGDRR